MIIAIHQPDYIPYPGYFYKIASCDCFVFLDDAQYSNEGICNWNRIKTPQGELRLKVPVNQSLGDIIKDVTTKDYLGWKQKQLKILKSNYSKSKFFEEIYADIELLLVPEYQNIAEMNISIIKFICGKFGISKRFERSSYLDITTKREERVIDICCTLDGDVYFSGNGAKVYQVEEHFTKRGIILQYTNYHSISYEQRWGAFLPDLSIIDYLFNNGYDWDTIEKQMQEENENIE